MANEGSKKDSRFQNGIIILVLTGILGCEVDPKEYENMLIFVVTYGLLVQFFLMSYPNRVKPGPFLLGNLFRVKLPIKVIVGKVFDLGHFG